MEVHHHSHAKVEMSWKEHFYQFFMLFLAVFCGFLAEYRLEHMIEAERAEQFVESFYNDLKSDTARISYYISFDEEKINALSNLPGCYDAILNQNHGDSCLLTIMEHTATNLPFVRTERTLDQLTNAGGFRLLKRDDADSISSYDRACDRLRDFQRTVYQESQDNVRRTRNSLANFQASAQMFRSDAGDLTSIQSFNRNNVTAPLLFSNDKDMLNKYFNELLLYYRATCEHRFMLLELKKRQTGVLRHFNEKYHFE